MVYVTEPTVRVYVVVFDNPPPDPVIVTVYVPAGVELLVIMVIVDESSGLLGLMTAIIGLKLADAPDGKPEAEKLIPLVFTPLPYVTVTVAVTLPPAFTDPLAGDTLIENVKKFAVTVLGEFMVTDTDVLVPKASPVQASKA